MKANLGAKNIFFQNVYCSESLGRNITLTNGGVLSSHLAGHPPIPLALRKDTTESCFGCMQLPGATHVVLVQLLELAWLSAAVVQTDCTYTFSWTATSRLHQGNALAQSNTRDSKQDV